MLHLIPQLHKERIHKHFIPSLDGNLLTFGLDIDLCICLADNRKKSLPCCFKARGKIDRTIGKVIFERIFDFTLAVNIILFAEVFQNVPRILYRNDCLRACFILIRDIDKHIRVKHTEFDAEFLDFLLQLVRKLRKRFLRDNVQNIDVFIVNALAALVYAKAQTSADFLTASEYRLIFDERAYLEHVRVVPPFFECGV